MNLSNLPTVCLVRHGETAWTISGQHTGHTDIPLTEEGERSARELGTKLHGWSLVSVLTSPLQRAHRTAELAGFGAQVETDADLMEWDYGVYEGRRTSEIRAERPGWKLFVDGCPGGETLEAVGVRADRVIARIRARSREVLMFAHRDILRVLVACWLGMATRDGRCFYLDTPSVSMLGYDHDLNEPIIRLLNDAQRSAQR
jgi:broad specificity phosphatase PhoE